MSKRNIQINGLTELSKKLKKTATLEDVKQVVKMNTSELSGRIQRKTQEAYTGHWEGNKFVKPTGASKRSAGTIKLTNDGLSGHAGLGMEYSPYLEKGTRFMSKRPVVAPSYRIQKATFKSDLERLMK